MKIKEYQKKQTNKWKTPIKSLLIGMILSLVFTSVSFAEGGGRYQEDPWSFGLMADTQWTLNTGFWDGFQPIDPSGNNPEFVSAALARAIEDEFIDADVKFVIQVGDLTDQAGDAGMVARAAAAQPLLDAKIGFFPLRGNHETYGDLYSRDDAHDMNVPAFKASFPQTQGTTNTFGATNFSSPGIDPVLNGLSYSFDYGDKGNNARFVIVDVEATSYTLIEPWSESQTHPVYGPGLFFWCGWTMYQHTEDVTNKKGGTITAGTIFRIDSSGYPSTSFYGYEVDYPMDDYKYFDQYSSDDTEFWPGMQQDWISDRLNKSTRGTEHAFVLSHRGLMGANHVDGLFGGNPAVVPEEQNTFYASLADNGVRYMLSGHDHLHNRAIVSSPDGTSQVQQIIHMAGSTKFYGPEYLNKFEDTKYRETQIAQELYKVGYYIYTIDGPRVLVDYYSTTEDFQDNSDYPFGPQDLTIDPDTGEPVQPFEPLYLPAPLNFEKKESYGYSTNGKQFLIEQGDSYTVVKDRFHGTKARILSGNNNSTTTDETPYKETQKQATDDQGTPLEQPVLDSAGNPVYEQDEDESGNPLFDQATDDNGNLIDGDLVYPVYVQVINDDDSIDYIQATDEDGNVIDEEGEIVVDGVLEHPVYEPVMVAVMEPVMVTDEVLSAPRALSKTVNTGWISRKVDSHKLVSDILSIWGMAELGTDVTDTYVLSMKHDFRKGFHGKNCNVAIATYVDGEWVNAVDENFGGEKKFVFGEYKSQYGLGTYGIDPRTKTVWAVLNYNADFAIVNDIAPTPKPKHKKGHKKMAKRW